MPPRPRPPAPTAADHSAPPAQPIEFWQYPSMRAALESRHFGRVIHAYRTHPQHPRDILQKQVGAWLHLDQGQLSRIENGHPPEELSKLTRWASVLKVPPELLWFTLPGGNAHLRHLRETRNWTPADAAARMRKHIHAATGRHPIIDARTIERIENGEITHLPPDHRAALRAVYGATTDEQLGLASTDPTPPATAAPAEPHHGRPPALLPDNPAPGIGELIRTRRLARGWSQDDLADALTALLPGTTVNRTEVSRYEAEARMPTADRVYRALTQALQTPEAELRAATARSWAERHAHRYGPRQPAWKRDPTPAHDQDRPHLGEQLAHLRRERGLTQEQLAERAGVSIDVVRKLEQQRKDSARLPTLHKLSNGLGVDITALLTETPAVPPSGDTDAEFGFLTAFPLALDLPLAARTSLGRSIGQEVIDALRERTVRMRRLDDFMGGADTFRLYNTELAGTISLIKDHTYTEPIGRSLLSIAAEQAQQAGWAAFDAGHHDLARKLYEYSLSSAQLAEDAALAGNALSMLSYQLITISKSGVEAASASCDWARDSSNGVRALMLERRAFAYANAGDQRQTETALTKAEDALYQGADSEEPHWVSWADQKEFRLIYGRCWAELHRPLRAVPILESVLAEFEDSEARNKAVYLTWLASAYIDAGEIEQAVTTLGRTLDLSSGVASVRPMNRVALLAKRLTAHRKLSSVTDLFDRISSVSTDPLRFPSAT